RSARWQRPTAPWTSAARSRRSYFRTPDGIKTLSMIDNPTIRMRADSSSVLPALLPIMAAVLVAFLVTGLAMPVLPLHVHEGLGLGTFVVGLVAGAQFAMALLTRFWSGHLADSRGAKQ